MNKTELSLLVLDAGGHVKAQSRGGLARLELEQPYAKGDTVVIKTSRWPAAISLVLDRTLPAASVWLTEDRFDFPVPFGEELQAYPPGAFACARPFIEARPADPVFWRSRRNLSENPLDRRGESPCYPHCIASVETRDESVFAARNTIDGVTQSAGHGAWPYQSWGDNEDPNAEITVKFGRTVLADTVTLWLRADYPHDNYWQSAALLFSDGSLIHLKLEKTAQAQVTEFLPREISWVKLCRLVRANGPSPFPALTQWAIYGRDINQ